MSNPIAPEKLAQEITTIYRSDRSCSESLIERYLEDRLKGIPSDESLALLEKTAALFKTENPCRDEFSNLFSLLLGDRISLADLSSPEMLERLVSSLNTVLDTLNRIIRVINTTLLGRNTELETIRHIIGSNVEGETGSDSLQCYLDRIQEAFMVAHQCFQKAAGVKVIEILDELDPDRIASQVEGGLKFGPLRKAELFEVYKQKFQTCKSFVKSGRFMDDLLREFERSCQMNYKAK